MFVFRNWRLRAASTTKALIRRVRPVEAGWPKPETWQKLKDAHEPVPNSTLHLQPGAASAAWLIFFSLDDAFTSRPITVH